MLMLSGNGNECKPLANGVDVGLGGSGAPGAAAAVRGQRRVGRGLHSFPFPLNLSLLCPVPLNLSLHCPPYNPTSPVDVSRSCSSRALT
jgi:hypothetical protein